MALDEATTRLLQAMREAGGRPLWELTLPEARALMSAGAATQKPPPDLAEVRAVRIRVSGGVVPARVYVPHAEGGPRGVVVYLHGGGWVIGSVSDYDNLTRRLAHASGCVVLSVDYRLAPEYRFPTALDDSWTALRWAADHISELAGRDVPLVVAGDSAGGNLAAVCAIRARDHRLPLALQVLVYPVVDSDFTTTSYVDPQNALMLTASAMQWFWDQYVPAPAARTHPEASPLRAPMLTHLAPALVVTAEHDVLRDEGELYATRLMQAGVPVQHHRFAGQMHGFLNNLDVLPASADAIEVIAGAVRKAVS